jgi:tripartite-type tricarboxylate transporter receptor subunit TctC
MKRREQTDWLNKISVCLLLLVSLVFVIGPGAVLSQEVKYPSKAVEVIVPFVPGGFIDVGARLFADPLSKELKVPVVIRNQPGAGGLIGCSAFLNTKPDGYTLLASTGAGVISTVRLSKNPAFDPRKDLSPIAYIAESPVAMSVPKVSPCKSFDDFLQLARNNPGKLKGGFSVPGGESHIMFMSIVRDARIETKIIPYVGTGQLNTAILGGHLDWMASSLPSVIPYARSEDVRVLLLTRRSPDLPSVPSGSDVGLPNVSFNMWMGFFLHPQIPRPIYDRLVSAVSAAAKDPELAKKLANAGFNLAYKNAHEFTALINEQWDIFGRVIKESDLKVD